MLHELATAVLVLVIGAYAASSLWWLVETFPLSVGWRPDGTDEWGLDEIQVRVLTIDAEDVVQSTVEAVPDGVAGVEVIAEADIDIEGATVHVVPESFDCAATNKGRALEWARRNVPCDTEYVLYLDEDTIITDLTGLPDADFVQFTEKPIYTGSRLAYLCEIFRVGYQLEQRAFHRLSHPLYAWGGGFAIRNTLEDRLTWDKPTITEDTNLIWRAARETDIDYQLVNTRFRNQAPPSLRSMLRQRRRWMSGTLRDIDLLPAWYRPISLTRVVAWALSPVPIGLLVVVIVPAAGLAIPHYRALSVALGVVLLISMVGGVIAYRKHPLTWPVFLLLTPLAAILHATGALWGLVRPIEEFEVTEKVVPETVEDVNQGLEEGAISDHEGTDRLVRESNEELDPAVFDH